MNKHNSKPEAAQSEQKQLGEIGLQNFEPYLMNRIMARYNHTLADALAEHGLTTPKMRVLAVLAVVHKPLIRELVVYTVINQSTLSRTLDAMEKEALIEREIDPNDGRVSRICLTEQGRTSFEAIWPSMAQSYEQLFSGISDEERGQFVGTLQKILRNIRKNSI